MVFLLEDPAARFSAAVKEPSFVQAMGTVS
jgi:hypothetical protein